MLHGILFAVSPDLMNALSVQELLCSLKLSGIDYTFCSECPPPSASFTSQDTLFSNSTNALAIPTKDYLVITDSADGAHAARIAGIPCIGYAPPGHCEDLSGTYALFEDFASVDVAYLARTHAHALGYPADILATERLILREFCKEDFPALYAMCTDKGTSSYMEETLSDYKTEYEKHLAYISNVYPFFDLALWGVFAKDSGQLIGRAGFSLSEASSDTFQLGYLIDVPYRRQGYAKELVPALLYYAKEMGYTEISARIKKDNQISIKVLEQCGFPYEQKKDASEGIVTYLLHLGE